MNLLDKIKLPNFDLSTIASASNLGLLDRFKNYDYTILVLILIVLTLSFFINYFLLKSSLGKSYQIFLMPGIIIHELSHLIFCVLTGAKVVSVTLFDAEGGRVEHEKPKLPIIGQLLISFAPFVIGVILIFVLASFLGLKGIDFLGLKTNITNIFGLALSFLSALRITDWKTWVCLYLILAVSVTLSPSKQDFKNIAITILSGFLIFAAFVFFNINFNLAFLPVAKIILVLSTVIFLLILSLAFSMIVFAITRLLKR
ncbi:MAG: M50 family metallopeptidase [Candidatus Berkelbacteria bacterium]|nr:M50 family metallopeptidase [Candidatus Berkelbacteria bacterium]